MPPLAAHFCRRASIITGISFELSNPLIVDRYIGVTQLFRYRIMSKETTEIKRHINTAEVAFPALKSVFLGFHRNYSLNWTTNTIPDASTFTCIRNGVFSTTISLYITDKEYPLPAIQNSALFCITLVLWSQRTVFFLTRILQAHGSKLTEWQQYLVWKS